MVQLIIGNKGKGKTKYLLEKVNSEVKDILGNICYLDKSTKHMFELNNKVRLINVSDFSIENTDQMYFDSFLKVAHLEGKDITDTIRKIQKISDKFGVNFYLSLSIDEADVPEELKELIAVAL